MKYLKFKIIPYEFLLFLLMPLASKQLDCKDRMPSVTITSQVLGVTSSVISSELDKFIQ
ncbi:hypothetical protein CLU96_3316 [Chryseobacterium sp. 52]|uniref:hypothetical protein n=1 Tax=Chryseobacterium sp. 52 TaxID=2035213 RepID=UPI000C41832E|nr:hypothetical protein [Chryseobacterium sp. 52]PIF46290.1 hypothetical protein CLU96_3316 [Chryseobacterium sp. 52]